MRRPRLRTRSAGLSRAGMIRNAMSRTTDTNAVTMAIQNATCDPNSPVSGTTDRWGGVSVKSGRSAGPSGTVTEPPTPVGAGLGCWVGSTTGACVAGSPVGGAGGVGVCANAAVPNSPSNIPTTSVVRTRRTIATRLITAGLCDGPARAPRPWQTPRARTTRDRARHHGPRAPRPPSDECRSA